MLNVGRMAPGGEGYYLATVADGVEDYYLGRGEAPGRWLGTATADLGLQGTVTSEQIRHVLAGLHPDTGDPLLAQRQRTVPGFDLTFRAPKSVAILYGLGDNHTSGEVTRAHDAAVDAALGYLERHALWTRRGHGGAEQVPSTGAVAAAFRHRTSRAGDPLLHTHVLVANLARTADDGRWRTLDSRRLYGHAKTAGYLYQAHLRWELTRQLGVAWEPVTNGTADLTGIPRPVIDAFSQRRHQILQLLADRGESSARAAQVATLDTRPAKQQVDPVGLRDRWRDRAIELGFDPDQLHRLLHRVGPLRDTASDRARTVEQLLGPEGLTGRASTFSRRDVLQAWCERLPTGAPIPDVEARADSLLDPRADAVIDLDRPDSTVRPLTSRDTIRLPDGRTLAAVLDEHRFTTPELLVLEQRLIDQAVGRRYAAVAQVPGEFVEGVLMARPSISGEQAAMVRRLTGSGAGVDVVVGKAGAGKTYALDAARAAWQTAGIPVIGTALAARAALELEAGAGIPSCTLDRLLADLGHPRHGGLQSGSVVVVDEAGMVGTRKLARLLDAAATADAKVVLVGDPHQLPEIDAGGVMRGLANRLDVIALADNRRQTQPWERDALYHLRDGTPAAAVSAYQRHGRITIGESADDVREQLVGDWWHARTELGLHGIMVAARRSDVADLNARARTRLAAAGDLTDPAVVAGDRQFQAGDQVVCLRNDRRVGVVNGTRGTVTAVDPDARTVTLHRDGTDDEVVLPADYLDAGQLDHGYALTAHKAQGLTTEATWVLGSDALYREWGYVALSRGRHSNRLYLVASQDPEPDAHHNALEASPDPVRRLATNLTRSRKQRLATDHAAVSDAEVADRASLLRQQLLTAEHAASDGRREALAERRDQLLAQRRDVAVQLDAARPTRKRGFLRRSPGQPEQDRLQASLSLVDRQLAQLDRQLDELSDPQLSTDTLEVATEWLAIDDEVERRAAARTATAEVDPPPYIAAVLGDRPDHPSHRRDWRSAVRAVETYRLRHAIDDPLTPLEERPNDLVDRRDYDTAAAQMTATRQRLLDDTAHREPPAPAHNLAI